MQLNLIESQKVFPTPVGVFPTLPARLGNVFCLPHARGGVSSVGSRGAV